LAIGLVLPLAWPGLHPAAAIEPKALDSLIGAGLGALFGGILAWALSRRHARREGRSSMVAAIALCGAFLGWQAALDIAILAALAMVVVALLVRLWPFIRTFPPLAWPALAAWLYVPLWKWLSGFWWPWSWF
jgi:NhaP-type Na+/H+ or K+/H+ antiporter